MSDSITSDLDPQMGFKNGLTVEHIILSITIVSSNRIIQYDDSCARIIERELMDYAGVKSVDAAVLYKHGNSDRHSDECGCGDCMRIGNSLDQLDAHLQDGKDHL